MDKKLTDGFRHLMRGRIPEHISATVMGAFLCGLPLSMKWSLPSR